MVNKEPYQKAFLEKMVRDVEPRYGLFNQNGNDTNFERALNRSRTVKDLASMEDSGVHDSIWARQAPYASSEAGIHNEETNWLSDILRDYAINQSLNPDPKVDETRSPDGLLRAYVNNLYKKLQPAQRTNAEIGSSFMNQLR
jgi:hypothetical protein